MGVPVWSVTCVLIGVLSFVRARARSGLKWADFLLLGGVFLYCRLLHRWSANRRHPFPKDGPAIIVCNHTCSADAAFLLAACDRPISMLVSREHFNVHPVAHGILKYIRCVPVIRAGPDPVALRRALSRLARGALVCLFPEGNLSGVARDRPRRAKPGAAFLALASRAPVYPVYITGGPRTDQLLNSWIFPTRRAARVVFGKPIDLTPFYDRPRSRQLIEEVTHILMEKIEDLKKQPK